MVNVRLFMRQWEPPEMTVLGVTVPNDLAGIREVADWIRAEPGFSVPFLNREGLLVRQEREGEQPWHQFYTPGFRIGLFKDGFDEIGWTYKTEEEEAAE